MFRSTLPHGERRPALVIDAARPGFDPRSRTGSDDLAQRRAAGCHRFDPRSRTGSDSAFGWRPARRVGFDPRSRTGSDPGHRRCETLNLCVSIHAPARGATGSDGQGADRIHVSIHAPARGATPRWRSPSPMMAMFRSTLPHGERLPLFPDPLPTASVSIHAPARGATRRRSSCPATCRRFDPRSRTGSDFGTRVGRSPARRPFRSTLPHGERPPVPAAPCAARSVSIHAPARGATTAGGW